MSGESDAQRLRAFVDAANQGSLSLYNANGNAAVLAGIDDATDAGGIQLSEGDGAVRARVIVDAEAQGDLALAGTDDVDRARLGLQDDDDSGFLALNGQRFESILRAERADPDAPNNGAVRVYAMDNDGNARVSGELVAAPATNSGELVLYDASGNPTIVLDGATGLITKSGGNGFLIPIHNSGTERFFMSALRGLKPGYMCAARRRSGRASRGRTAGAFRCRRARGQHHSSANAALG